MKTSVKTVLVLLALLLPALLVGLSDRLVYKIQEVRIAETAREMLASGDWAVPRYNGELRLQKPPLPYWLTATSYGTLGVNESATRVPAALFGLLTAALLWCWARGESGVKIAGNGVAVLAVSYIGLRYFRSGEADAILLFFITAASWLGYDLLQGRCEPLRRALFGLALGLGFLTKGPAALAIPLLTLLAMALLEKRAGRERTSLRNLFGVTGAILLLVAAFGWYVWILWRFPEIAQHFFGKQVDETFVSGTHAKPVWWYLAHCFEFFAPWGVLLVPAGVMAYRQRREEMAPLLRFAWIWLGVVFVLLTVTVNKQMQYALLFAPPLAIILGHYLAQAQGGFAKANRILFWLFCIAVLAGAGFALRKSAHLPDAFLWLAIPLVPLVVRQLVRERELSFPVLLVAGMTSMAFLYGEAYLSKEPGKVAAQTLMSEAALDAGNGPVVQRGPKPGFGELSFYAGRVVRPVDDREIAALLERYPRIVVVGEGKPEVEKAQVELIRQVDEFGLYRVTRQP